MLFGKHLAEDSAELDKKIKLDDDDDDGDDLEVHANDNHVYFYTDVNKASILALNKNIRRLGAELMHSANVFDIPVPNIKLHINSPGGTLLDGLAAVDYVRNSKVPIHTFVEGIAASAATLFSVMANKRSINKHSYMLIHQLSSGTFGKYHEMIDDMENNKTLMDAIYSIYTEKTKIPAKVLKEVLKKDLYFDAKTCLKYGLVDEIIQ